MHARLHHMALKCKDCNDSVTYYEKHFGTSHADAQRLANSVLSTSPAPMEKSTCVRVKACNRLKMKVRATAFMTPNDFIILILY